MQALLMPDTHSLRRIVTAQISQLDVSLAHPSSFSTISERLNTCITTLDATGITFQVCANHSAQFDPFRDTCIPRRSVFSRAFVPHATTMAMKMMTPPVNSLHTKL